MANNNDLPKMSDMLKQHNEEQKEALIAKVIEANNRSRAAGRSAPMSEQEMEDVARYLRDPEAERKAIDERIYNQRSEREIARLEQEMLKQHQSDLGIHKDSSTGEYFRDGRYCDEYGNFL